MLLKMAQHHLYCDLSLESAEKFSEFYQIEEITLEKKK